jgi:UDP-glucuronate 4-epimerase
MSKILVTGAAGFVGFHLVKSLVKGNDEIAGLDNLSNNHDYTIKLNRLGQFNISGDTLNRDLTAKAGNLTFFKADLLDKTALKELFDQIDFDLVIHLAAQTGVRHSVIDPQSYIDNNITAFNNLLECCRNHGVSKMIYASSSSVYGQNNSMPYRESYSTDAPVSIYAVTKKTNELLAVNYTWQNKMSCVGLRFFTVYGPWCRTDMAAYIFLKAITEGKEIHLFNDGDMLRDFTYVDDITESIRLVKEKILLGDFECPSHEIYNVGTRHPATLSEYLPIIEQEIGIRAIIKNKPLQLGEVKATYADVRKLEKFIGFKPGTDLKSGVKVMVDWFKNYYNGLSGD